MSEDSKPEKLLCGEVELRDRGVGKYKEGFDFYVEARDFTAVALGAEMVDR